jgi:hypothetical protein
MHDPSLNRRKDTYSGHGHFQRPPRPTLAGLLASEVDIANKTLANSGDSDLLSNFPPKGGWKVFLHPL